MHYYPYFQYTGTYVLANELEPFPATLTRAARR